VSVSAADAINERSCPTEWFHVAAIWHATANTKLLQLLVLASSTPGRT